MIDPYVISKQEDPLEVSKDQGGHFEASPMPEYMRRHASPLSYALSVLSPTALVPSSVFSVQIWEDRDKVDGL